MLGGRYQLIDVLGSGDHGEVWRGRDAITDRPVAIKILHPRLAADPRLVDRFQRARPVLTGLWHPGIARLLDVVVGDGRLGLVTDLVSGLDLRRYLPVTPQRALRVCASIAGALAAAHRVGVVHGDIKPSNVVIQAQGGDAAILTDFSVALFARAGHARLSAYHSPDEIEGAVPGPAGDIYALGMLLQDMVARPNGELPSVAISSTVAECLRPDPAARPTAQTLHDHLLRLRHEPASYRDSPRSHAAALESAPSGRTPPPPATLRRRSARSSARNRPRIGLFAAIGLTALLLVAVGIVLFTRA